MRHVAGPKFMEALGIQNADDIHCALRAMSETGRGSWEVTASRSSHSNLTWAKCEGPGIKHKYHKHDINMSISCRGQAVQASGKIELRAFFLLYACMACGGREVEACMQMEFARFLLSWCW